MNQVKCISFAVTFKKFICAFLDILYMKEVKMKCIHITTTLVDTVGVGHVLKILQLFETKKVFENFLWK